MLDKGIAETDRPTRVGNYTGKRSGALGVGSTSRSRVSQRILGRDVPIYHQNDPRRYGAGAVATAVATVEKEVGSREGRSLGRSLQDVVSGRPTLRFSVGPGGIVERLCSRRVVSLPPGPTVTQFIQLVSPHPKWGASPFSE